MLYSSHEILSKPHHSPGQRCGEGEGGCPSVTQSKLKLQIWPHGYFDMSSCCSRCSSNEYAVAVT